jgi:hypothetical protein
VTSVGDNAVSGDGDAASGNATFELVDVIDIIRVMAGIASTDRSRTLAFSAGISRNGGDNDVPLRRTGVGRASRVDCTMGKRRTADDVAGTRGASCDKGSDDAAAINIAIADDGCARSNCMSGRG